MGLLAAGAFLCVAADSNAPSALAKPEATFSFEAIRDRARSLGKQAYQPASMKVPEFLKKLSYDDYQGLRFRPELGPWHEENLPFTLQFFHLDFNHRADSCPVVACGESLEEIAQRAAADFRCRWRMASEFRYEHQTPVYLTNVFAPTFAISQTVPELIRPTTNQSVVAVASPVPQAAPSAGP